MQQSAAAAAVSMRAAATKFTFNFSAENTLPRAPWRSLNRHRNVIAAFASLTVNGKIPQLDLGKRASERAKTLLPGCQKVSEASRGDFWVRPATRGRKAHKRISFTRSRDSWTISLDSLSSLGAFTVSSARQLLRLRKALEKSFSNPFVCDLYSHHWRNLPRALSLESLFCPPLSREK